MLSHAEDFPNMNPDHFKSNKLNWNDRVAAHAESSDPSYDIDGFLEGKSTLKSIEIEKLGDVSGKSLLHLMCHFGLDTLSWRRRGAEVTGIDFSNEAIKLAQLLTERAQLDARFICSNVYDLPEVLDERFDIVIANYGITCWLPDFDGFAKVTSRFLKAGGIFILIDGHPFLDLLDYDKEKEQLEFTGRYFHDPDPDEFNIPYSYTGKKKLANSLAYEWSHDLGSIIAAIKSNGLNLVSFKEYPNSFFKRYSNMIPDGNGYWRFPESLPQIPSMFSIKAEKT